MTIDKTKTGRIATIIGIAVAVFSLMGQPSTARGQDGAHLSMEQTFAYICDKINGFGEQSNLLEKETYKAKRVGALLEIEESSAYAWRASKPTKIVHTIDFTQLDPNWVSANGKTVSAQTLEKRKAIKEVWTNADGTVTEKSAFLIHILCSDETAARRLANAFKHAIELSGGPATKPDPFDK